MASMFSVAQIAKRALSPAIIHPMSRVHVYKFVVEFGDCDPAGIVYFPNFHRWADASSRYFFTASGVPRWAEMAPILGTPIVENQARFVSPASYGDALEVHTTIPTWTTKGFEHLHRIMRGTELIAEIQEKRIFAIRHPENPQRIRAVAVPDIVLERCR
jgi:4-hydroxybenzoyl-CoA thioesterase